MTKLFRIVALFEGVSYILLLFVAVPVKYFFGDPQYVKLLGLPHGLWFMIYIIMAVMMQSEGRWTKRVFYQVLLAGIIPFATFYIDYKHLRTAD